MEGRHLFLVLIILVFGTSVHADFQKGFEAYNSGDYATALKEWESLAEQGYADAQYGLGMLYYRGHGVARDYKAAVKWYKLVAEQGFAPGQLWLGTMYYIGEGVTQDYRSAAKWIRLAAEQGDADAQLWLSQLYYDGQGVTQDSIRAHMWVIIAASQGNEEALWARKMDEDKMSSIDVSKARDLSLECIAKKFKDC